MKNKSCATFSRGNSKSHPSILGRNGKNNERFSSWLPSEAKKRSHHSVLRGKSARKTGGFLAWE